ncbi:hypothetical protein Pelo_1566 [Pelomyxa schiedti]|nr:hypothetical protein Pelo_1566 [Pelomyxa schiedti]
MSSTSTTSSTLHERLAEIAATTEFPDFLKARIESIPANERAKWLVVLDADGVLWKEDIADEILVWMIQQGYVDRHWWSEYERVYRPDHERGCIFLLSVFAGWEESVFSERVSRFYKEFHSRLHLRNVPCAAAINLKKMGFPVYIVTASPTGMLMPCLEYFGSDAILGMDFGFDGRGIITGNLAGPSCYGPGKASKVATAWRASSGPEVSGAEGTSHILLAAGDAPLDVSMMEIAEIPWACTPDTDLLAVAQSRGWQILHRPTGEAMGSHADKFNKWAGVI